MKYLFGSYSRGGGTDLAEVAVTISSSNPDVDNLMKTAADDPIWEGLESATLDGSYTRGRNNDYYNRVVQALVNLTKIKQETGKGFRVAINLNMNQGADVEMLVDSLSNAGAHLDLIIFQAFQPAGRGAVNEGLPAIEWQKLDENAWREYVEQTDRLVKDGKVGAAVFIDPAPPEIEHSLNLREVYGEYYDPEITPAVSVGGLVRQNVVS
jgi:hypothetical protein